MRTACLMTLAALVVGALAAGCSALVSPDTHLLDDDAAVITPDVDTGIPDRTDAGGDPDAWQMPGCPSDCTDGTVCDGVQCVCPFDACCPACGADQLCIAGSCTACGNPGEACCDGGACRPGAECNGVTCDACGEVGQPCCEGNTCAGSAMCGTDGQCHGATTTCGEQGEPCCLGGVCNGGLECAGGFPIGNGICQPCGGDSEMCCTGGVCDSGLGCFSNTCGPCGGNGQRCCLGGRCRDGTSCHSGFCR